VGSTVVVVVGESTQVPVWAIETPSTSIWQNCPAAQQTPSQQIWFSPQGSPRSGRH
jgi:hypothetical protein